MNSVLIGIYSLESQSKVLVLLLVTESKLLQQLLLVDLLAHILLVLLAHGFLVLLLVSLEKCLDLPVPLHFLFACLFRWLPEYVSQEPISTSRSYTLSILHLELKRFKLSTWVILNVICALSDLHLLSNLDILPSSRRLSSLREGSLHVVRLLLQLGVNGRWVFDSMLETLVSSAQRHWIPFVFYFIIVHQNLSCPFLEEVHLGLSEIKVFVFFFLLLFHR